MYDDINTNEKNIPIKVVKKRESSVNFEVFFFLISVIKISSPSTKSTVKSIKLISLGKDTQVIFY